MSDNYMYEQQPPQEEKKGMSIASMVLGIVGLIAWCIPIIGGPVGIVGLILGIVGMKKGGKGMAIAGIIMSVITIILAVINAIAVSNLMQFRHFWDVTNLDRNKKRSGVFPLLFLHIKKHQYDGTGVLSITVIKLMC